MFSTNDIHPLTDFQRNTKDYVKRLKEIKQPEILTINGKPSLVIQDAAAYEEMANLINSLKHIKMQLTLLIEVKNDQLMTSSMNLKKTRVRW